ncbi:hypothetical protein Ddc_14138 [Ditylenchus destructor]|nr:hypothetical protein Ddc_14138 [Ditylenchus destructor]
MSSVYFDLGGSSAAGQNSSLNLCFVNVGGSSGAGQKSTYFAPSAGGKDNASPCAGMLATSVHLWTTTACRWSCSVYVFQWASRIMWYQLFRFFSRKELVKLQFGNRFFDKAIRESKLPALHFIDRLVIINLPNMGIVYFIGKGEISDDKLIPGEEFCPPSYVRFSEVTLTTLIIDGDFMERLKKHKITFTNCVFTFDARNVHEESANETMKTLMQDVFTECSKVLLNTNKWTSVKQLKFCTLPGVYKCDKLFFDGDKMVLSIDDPLFESMFEWLYSSRGSTKKVIVLKGIAGCEALLRKLTTKFVDDIECHTYGLCVYGLQEDFLNEFDGFSAVNTTTGERMRSNADFDDDGDARFFLSRFLPV